ncbi:MAG TPA: GNAT family N-acetyltransferase [Gaiellaceae bacterium]|nr:GNAT family N-acetyltransferase [Gaiellaceae bacterium]
MSPGRVVLDSFECARASWSRLAHESRNVFSTSEWAETWWRCHGRGEHPLIVACREGAETTALLPLYVWSRRPVRVARFIGHGPADQLGPICGPGGRAAAAVALRRLTEDESVDVVLAELLPASERWSETLGQRPVAAESTPRISLSGGWSAYLERRTANLRQQIRRRERELGRRHEVRFRLASSRTLQDDLQRLFVLHRGRWGAGSAFLRFEGFHRAFAALALERGWLRLWLLDLDDSTVAAWYGFRFAGVESYYQAGRDISLRDASVGLVLLAHSIREAAEDGMTEYRLLRGDERYKQRLADDDPGLETFALARGALGAAAAAALRVDAARWAFRRFAPRH